MKPRELWLERVLLPLTVRHLHGPKRVPYGEDELMVVCLAKDADYHIGPFIEHYLRLGARHIALLDNGSRDATVARASRYPQVSVLQTTLRFRGNNRSMRRYLIRRFGAHRRWVLCADVDELFDFAFSDRLALSSLLRYLRSRSYTAMAAYLLDMFPDRPLRDLQDEGVPPSQASPYYDISAVRKLDYFAEDGYRGDRFVRHNTVANPEVKRYIGGIRAQAFDLPEVYLIKHPLMFLDGRLRFSHQHFVDHAAVADITGVLYHYKFVPGFTEKVEEAVRTGAYAAGSYEYRRYRDALQRQPDLCLKTHTARKLQSVDDLVASGFLHVTPEYRDWVERTARRPSRVQTS